MITYTINGVIIDIPINVRIRRDRHIEPGLSEIGRVP